MAHARAREGLTSGLLAAVMFISASSSAIATPSAAASSSATTNLTAVAFPSEASGFGLFTRQGAVKCLDLIGHTVNGGATFASLVPVTSWTCSSSFGPSTLAFDASGDGFLYGPYLHVTHDAGRTWTSSAQPGSVLAIEALGRSIWMVEAGCAPRSSARRCPLRLFTSTNGGRAWSRSNSPSGAVGGFSPGALGETYLVRVSGSSAYLMSAPLSTSTHDSDGRSIWFTSNSGATWSKRRLACGFPAGFAAGSVVLSAAPQGTLFAACGGAPTAGYQPKSTLRSSTGGRTWKLESSCGFTPKCKSAPIGQGYLGGITAISPTTVFLTGDRSALEVSRDGGVHWQIVRPLIGDSGSGTKPPIFFGSVRGVVLQPFAYYGNTSTLWKTVDGGAHWKALSPKIT